MRAGDLELAGYELDAGDDADGGGSRALVGRRLSGGVDVLVVLPDPDGRAAADPTVFTRLRAVEGVVPVIDAGTTAAGQPYVVVERWSNGDLADRLEAGPLTAAETVVVGRTIGRALIGAHESGLAHGAVAPASVTFTDDGRPRLTGFATAAGAPTPSDDLAALGALLVTCLDGDGATPLVQRSDVPADVAEVIDRAASSEPGERRTSLDVVENRAGTGGQLLLPPDTTPWRSSGAAHPAGSGWSPRPGG